MDNNLDDKGGNNFKLQYQKYLLFSLEELKNEFNNLNNSEKNITNDFKINFIANRIKYLIIRDNLSEITDKANINKAELDNRINQELENYEYEFKLKSINLYSKNINDFLEYKNLFQS